LQFDAGFPDAGVVPDALQQHAAGSPPPDNGFFASRFPRKLCDKLMKTMPDTAFVAFNTLGIPGSTQSPPARWKTIPLLPILLMMLYTF